MWKVADTHIVGGAQNGNIIDFYYYNFMAGGLATWMNKSSTLNLSMLATAPDDLATSHCLIYYENGSNQFVKSPFSSACSSLNISTYGYNITTMTFGRNQLYFYYSFFNGSVSQVREIFNTTQSNAINTYLNFHIIDQVYNMANGNIFYACKNLSSSTTTDEVLVYCTNCNAV